MSILHKLQFGKQAEPEVTPDTDAYTREFGSKSGLHSHPPTHPTWMQFSDKNCEVCGTNGRSQ